MAFNCLQQNNPLISHDFFFKDTYVFERQIKRKRVEVGREGKRNLSAASFSKGPQCPGLGQGEARSFT